MYEKHWCSLGRVTSLSIVTCALAEAVAHRLKQHIEIAKVLVACSDGDLVNALLTLYDRPILLHGGVQDDPLSLASTNSR